MFVILSLKHAANSSHLKVEKRLSSTLGAGIIRLSIIEKSALELLEFIDINFEKSSFLAFLIALLKTKIYSLPISKWTCSLVFLHVLSDLWTCSLVFLHVLSDLWTC